MKVTSRNELVFDEEELLNFLTSLCNELRGKGIPLGISEIESAIRVLRNYCSLRGYIRENGTYTLPVVEFEEVLKSILAKRTHFEKIFEETFNNFILRKSALKYKIMKDIESHLRELKIHYGDKIPISKMKYLIRNPNRKQAFYTLRKLGIIRKDSRRGIYEVLSRDKVRSIALKCIGYNFKDLNKIANYVMLKNIQKCSLRALKDEKDFYLDSIEDIIQNKLNLELLPTTKLLELSYYASEKNKRYISKYLTQILVHRISETPMEVRKLDENKLVSLLKEHGFLSSRILSSVLNYNPRAVDSLIKDHKDRDVIINSLPLIKLESQRYIVSKLFRFKLSKDKILRIISNINPRALSVLEKAKYVGLNPNEQLLIKAAAKLAKAFEYYRRAFLEDNVGYYDMANSVLEEYGELMRQYSLTSKRVGKSKIEKTLLNKIDLLNTLLASASAKETSALPLIVKIYGASFHTLRLLKEIYEAAIDIRTKRNLLHLASIIVQRLKTRYRSYALLSKRKKTKRKTASIVIRDSIYNVLRFEEQPIVYYTRKKDVKVVLLVDVSGSMREFAEHAILIASTFVKSISDLIVFRENVIHVPRSTLRNPVSLVEFLFNLKFEGWTNIALALSEVSRRRCRKIVVMISDLKQTVKGYDPLSEARKAIRGSVEFIVLTPPIHDEVFANNLKTLGAKVHIVRDIDDFVKKLAYIFRGI